MSRKGFTLIELLAVITIMGILMTASIIGINKIIENTRRNAFAILAQTYIDSVRASVLADELQCTNDDGATWLYPTQLPNNHHCYFNIQTADGSVWQYQSLGVVESGKSPWGKLDVVGTVRFYKKQEKINGVSQLNYYYLIRLKDTSGHGTPGADFVEEHRITRKSIVTSGSRAAVSMGTGSSSSSRPYLCYLT